MAQSLSQPGARFIARFEGFSARLYNDPAGHCTIGYGHLVHHGRCNGTEPAEFRRGITRQRALALLASDAAAPARAIDASVDVRLAQHQFDALVSFAFNVGVGAFRESTLLRKLNAGNYAAVPGELSRWVKAGGQTLPGLVRRRRAEGVLFRHGRYEAAGDEATGEGDELDDERLESGTRPDPVPGEPRRLRARAR